MDAAFDPYQVLGLKRSASEDEVRTAYKYAARHAHPDAGGSEEAFQRVKRAYDILKDQERRAKFDATGDASETTPAPNPDNEALAWISRVIAAALGGPQDPTTYDLRAAVLDALGKHSQQLSENFLQARLVNERAKKLRKRFKRTARGDGDNVMDGIVAWHESQSAVMMARLEGQIPDVKRAIEIVTEYGFEKDIPLHQLMFQRGATNSSTGSGWRSGFFSTASGE